MLFVPFDLRSFKVENPPIKIADTPFGFFRKFVGIMEFGYKKFVGIMEFNYKKFVGIIKIVSLHIVTCDKY